MRLLDNRQRVLAPLEREAHAWLRRLTSGSATVADAEALRQWCATSEAHEAAFVQAQAVWGVMGEAGQRVSNRDALPATPRRQAAGFSPRRRFMLGGFAATAATAAGVTLVFPPLDLWPSLADLRADYRTGKGEQRQVRLTPNIMVDLNTQTSIAVRSSAGRASGIELIDGEAAVDAAPAAHSFTVAAGNGRIVSQQGGARFEVRRKGQNTRVTCLAGTVRIERGDDSLVLISSQQAVYNQLALGSASAIDTAAASAWRQGVLVFRQTPLNDVIDEINRYRPGRVVLLNSAMESQPLSGRFRIDNLETALQQICQAFHVQARSLPAGILLLS